MKELTNATKLVTKLRTKTDYKSEAEVNRDLDDLLWNIKVVERKTNAICTLCNVGTKDEVCDKVLEVLDGDN